MTDQSTVTQRHTFQDQASRRVSFILVTRNRARFIGKALDMARQLVGPDDEMIVVDGASTDGTAEIIASYGNLVDVFISEPDVSSGDAFNKGMLLAHGKYIKWLTDDDIYYGEAIQRAIEVLEAHPEVDFLDCGGTRQVGNERTLVYVPPGVGYGEDPEDLFRYGACGCGFVIRRSALARVGLMNHTGIATDGEFLVQAITSKANVKFCRINMFHHPIYDHSAVIRQRRAWEQDMDRIAKRYCSPGFYLRYRMKSAVRRNPILHRPARAARSVAYAVLAALGSKKARTQLSPAAPVWDGGFS